MSKNTEAEFQIFWAAFPKKVNKGVARLQFNIAIKHTPLQTMLDALAWQKQQPQWIKDGGAFIPKPENWLHGERWEDEPVETPRLKDQTVKNMDAVREWLQSGE